MESAYIDTHCHLNFEAFELDLDEVVRRAKKLGIEKIVVPGANLESSRKAIEVAEKYQGVYAAVGFHPHHCKGIIEKEKNGEKIDNQLSEIKKELEKMIKSKVVVAIGECGLDYFEYKHSKHSENKITPKNKIVQKRLFGIQIQLAKAHNLPIIIHNRQAGNDLFDVIDHFSKDNGEYPKGVVHCISGAKELLAQILAAGFYVGVDGNVTYDKQVAELARIVPLDRLLLETDSPYLTPEPLRKKKIMLKEKLRNEPISVKLVARELSKLKDIDLNEVVIASSKNAQELFKL